ncbi:MAG: BamA/TamA family outer membrane protein, partial [Phycisphaerae bacterium]|nr:BamA/TamA family outer membrane protein [Phycisphaerae bacterium]
EVGFIDATFDPQIDFAARPATLDITFRITEGKLVRIGKIRVIGNSITRGKVIRRELEFFPEQELNVKAIRDSERRLRNTGLFEQSQGGVRITSVPTADPQVRDIIVEVKETETGRIFFGAGVSSDLGVLGNLGYTEQNFDIHDRPENSREFWRGEAFKGAGQTFSINLQPGTELQRYSISFVEPYIFDRDVSLHLSAYYTSWDRIIYDEVRGGTTVGLGKRLSKYWRGFATLRLEAIRIEDIDIIAPKDVTDVKGSSGLTSITLRMTRDKTDNRFDPSTGTFIAASLEQTGVLGGDYTFTKLSLDGRRYWTVLQDAFDRKSVLAARGHIGYIAGDAPIFERFYAGGHGSIRGFDYRGAGPHKVGEPVGGDFLLLLGGEYSFPIYGNNLRGVFFLDTGTVESTGSLNDYRATAGFGLRFQLPIPGQMNVPFDFAFAFPIAKGPDDETQVFSFTIGRSF